MSFNVIDIETDSLDPSVIWCIVVKDLDTGVVTSWSDPAGRAGECLGSNGGSFLSYTSGVSCWVGHNIIAYDLPALVKLVPGFTFDPARVIDTLVVTRYLNYAVSGGNSLEAWGERLGFAKGNFSDFSSFTPEMLLYCTQDVELTGKLYAQLTPYLQSLTHRSALRLEHDTAVLCRTLHTNGFYFDIDAASALHSDVSSRLGTLTGELHSTILPRYSLIREVVPRTTRHGTLHRGDFRFLPEGESLDLSRYTGGAFSLIRAEPFNPGSPKQCVERLWEYGWRPYDKTKGHIAVERLLRGGTKQSRAQAAAKLEYFQIYGWKINEANLNTLPGTAPEVAHRLVEWLMVNARRSTLEEWFEAYNPQTHRIHGNFNHIGAWTGRMSHSGPNMANIPGVILDKAHKPVFGFEGRYGADMRSLWQASPGKYLVGVDADGIQLRILAHYINDPRYIEAIIKGNKDNGTDQHSLNKLALGDVCRDRDTAKTFIYAFLLGAGVAKVAEILGCTLEEARAAIDAFLNYYPGLRGLKDNVIPADAARGYFIGLDGRIVVCDSEHLMLAGYLQNGEAVIMKTANLIWSNNLVAKGIKFKQVNFVHDEWQVEVDSLTDATEAGNIMVQAIEQAGSQLRMKCPLTGNASIGRNWLETH